MKEDFTLEDHPSKPTCKIATSKSGEKFFVKFPRTVDDERAGMEEVFNELLEAEILTSLGVSDINYSIEFMGMKLAIIQRYYPKSWKECLSESLEITNKEEWPLFLAVEVWVRQIDRSPDKHEHIGLVLVDGEGQKYRALPVDLGCSFIGQPGGYSGLDEDLNAEWPDKLFWAATHEFDLSLLEQALNKIEKVAVVETVERILNKIFSETNLPESVKEHLKKHGDGVAYFLLHRRKKLRAVLLEWWNSKHPQELKHEATALVQ